MSDFNRNLRGPGNGNNWYGKAPSTWIGGMIIAVLIIIGLAYTFSGGMMGRREAVAPVVGPAPAITAVPAPAPSNSPKP
jgi:hypothetical protein